VAASALDTRIPVQLRDIRLQGIASGVIDLLASLIDSAFSVHGVAKAFKGEHKGAIWPHATIPRWVIAHAPPPCGAHRQVVVNCCNQVAVCRVDAALTQAFRNRGSQRHLGPDRPGWEQNVAYLNLRDLGHAHPGMDAKEQHKDIALRIATGGSGDAEEVPVLARL